MMDSGGGDISGPDGPPGPPAGPGLYALFFAIGLTIIFVLWLFDVGRVKPSTVEERIAAGQTCCRH